MNVPFSPCQIYICEDEAIIATDLKRRLERLGYTVCGMSARGEDALERIPVLEVDLVLMDIHLAGSLDGIETARLLHQRVNVPIIYATAHGEAPYLRKALQVPVYGYLMKPVDEAALVAAVETALDRRQLEQKLRQSESRLNEILSSLTDCVATLDQHQTILWCNDAYRQLPDYAEGAALCRNCRRQAGACKDCPVKATFADGLPHETEVTLPGAWDKPERHLQVVVTVAAREPDGRVERVIVVLRDVTRQRAAELQLNRTRADYRDLIDSLEVGVFRFEPEKIPRLAHANAALAQILGCSSADLLLHLDFKQFCEEAVAFNDLVTKLLGTGQIQDYLLRLRRMDGESILVRVSARTTRAADGRLLHVDGLIQDVTEQERGVLALRESEQRHRELASENASLAEAKSWLLDEVNHRVSNNLSSILGILAMERERARVSLPEAAAIIGQVTDRVSGLARVHSLLSSKKWAAPSLHDIVEQTVYGALNAASMRVQVDIQEPLPALTIPPKQATALAMVLNELTTNSIKYAFRDRQGGRLKLAARTWRVQRHDMLEISFGDDGDGWPPEVLEGKRHGVGLQLIRESLRSPLRGELHLTSAAGAVATLTLRLAAARGV